MGQRKAQREAILEWLQDGHSITAIEALELCGSMRLGARIKELRDEGYPIVAKPETHTRADGRKSTYARYSLEEAEHVDA